MVSTVKQVSIAVTPKTLGDLGRLVKKHKQKQADTARAYARRHRLDELPPAEAAAVKVAIRDAALARRASGRLLDTLDAAVAEAVRRELAARGVDPDRPPEIPTGELEFPGRFIGTTRRAVPRRVGALIPEAYARAVQAAAWIVSAPHIHAMRAWQARHPEWNGLDDSVSPLALAELRRHSKELVTTGDVYRDALDRLIEEESAPE